MSTRPRSWRWLWLCFPLLAVVESLSHAWIRAGVPEPADVRAAAGFIREQFAPGDALTVTPVWADPILRAHLGDRIPLSMAGRSDLAAYDRLWTLALRDEPSAEAAGRPVELTRGFGDVTVYRNRLPAAREHGNLVDRVYDAQVSIGRGADRRPCRLRHGGPARGGGLGKGVIKPARHFACPGHGGRRFVAPVVIEDLELQPRYCVYQPAMSGGAVRTIFPAVRLAERLVFYVGLYYEDERYRAGVPVTMRVSIGGRERAKIVHRDGQGWLRRVVPTGGLGTAEVAIEVSSPRPVKRGLCWYAGLREAAP